jgi:hypothetical protein
MSDAFEEVEEGLRRDRYEQWLRKNGTSLLIAVALAVGGVAGWQFYKNWERDQARNFSTEFVAAQKLMQDGKAEEAAAAFQAMTGRGPEIYRELAGLERAAALSQQGDLQGALAAFDAAAEKAGDPIIKASAQLRAAYIVADTQDFQAVQARLTPLIERGGPVSYLARELLGVEAWEAGQFDLARDTFENLRLAPEAPESVSQRAEAALAVLGPGAPNRAPPPQATPNASPGEKK